jgi:prevent-host-death family protein
MQSLTMLAFRKQAESVLAKVMKGHRFVLTYRGKPVARLEPIDQDEVGADPIYELDKIASDDAQPLNNRQIDQAVYGK